MRPIRPFLRLSLLAATAGLLAACSVNNAADFASTIVDGAKRLQGSTQTTTTVLCAPSAKRPYVLVIYPPVRNADDEKLLTEVAPKALELTPAGAALSPKAEGLTDTLAVWQKGSLATFSTGFRGVAQAKRVLAVVKENGEATDVTLQREGSSVYIVGVR